MVGECDMRGTFITMSRWISQLTGGRSSIATGEEDGEACRLEKSFGSAAGEHRIDHVACRRRSWEVREKRGNS